MPQTFLSCYYADTPSGPKSRILPPGRSNLYLCELVKALDVLRLLDVNLFKYMRHLLRTKATPNLRLMTNTGPLFKDLLFLLGFFNFVLLAQIFSFFLTSEVFHFNQMSFDIVVSQTDFSCGVKGNLPFANKPETVLNSLFHPTLIPEFMLV